MRKRRPASRDKTNLRRNNNEVNIKSSSQRKREKIKHKKRQKVLFRRRLLVLILFFALLAFLIKLLISHFSGYKNYTYPAFRDEVLEEMGSRPFVAKTEGRSLTISEKTADLEKIYSSISRNYPVDNDNEEDFKAFVKSFDKYKDMVKTSKSDQEYFEILNNYLLLLNDSRVKVLDTMSFDGLLDYYKNNPDKSISKTIQNEQAENRYKRSIKMKDDETVNGVSLENNAFVLRMKDFNLKKINSDIENYKNLVYDNPQVSNVVIDLSGNSSVNEFYWQDFAKYLLHSDYSSNSLVFYRGNLLKDRLKVLKEEKTSFSTSFVENPAEKYSGEEVNINLKNYDYFDEIKLTLSKETDFPNKNIYILVDDETCNEAIKFAACLKENTEAYLIKNSSQSESTRNDLIYNFPSSLILLDYSGLIVSINDNYSLTNEKNYLQYDQFINSEYPLDSVLSSF